MEQRAAAIAAVGAAMIEVTAVLATLPLLLPLPFEEDEAEREEWAHEYAPGWWETTAQDLSDADFRIPAAPTPAGSAAPSPGVVATVPGAAAVVDIGGEHTR